ncbi:MAG: efflux RND transporter periplasmic adaptor subunit [bacterium]|nr:efflux RND transporter periplasmic adaptor subunit [bacterium]
MGVHQKDLPLIRSGFPVTISRGREFKDISSSIDYVSPIISAETRTALARVVMPNPDGRWQPGSFVTARVEISTEQVRVVVPNGAASRAGVCESRSFRSQGGAGHQQSRLPCRSRPLSANAVRRGPGNAQHNNRQLPEIPDSGAPGGSGGARFRGVPVPSAAGRRLSRHLFRPATGE